MRLEIALCNVTTLKCTDVTLVWLRIAPFDTLYTYAVLRKACTQVIPDPVKRGTGEGRAPAEVTIN
jgi:hypothetical protein